MVALEGTIVLDGNISEMYNERVEKDPTRRKNLAGKNRGVTGISKIAWTGQKIKI